MKWIKGILVLATIMFAHSTISINDIEARNSSKTSSQKPAQKAKKSNRSKKSGAADLDLASSVVV